MEMIHSTQEFNQAVQSGVVLVDFFATWCGPCKMLGPVLEEVASDRSEIRIIKVDIDENLELAKSFGIMSVPTLMLYKDGRPVASKTGYMPKDMLVEWINEQ